MKDKYNVAILGATGAVGTRLISELAKSEISVDQVKFLASKRSAGKKLPFKDQMITVEEATPASFQGIDLVLASAGGDISKKLLPEAVKRGAVCVDNTSAFRMDPNVPLVVPGVNDYELKNHHGIIANPNCSTIQMVAALNPIRQKWGLKQIIVSTYQAVSGAGQSAINELMQEARNYLDDKSMSAEILPTKGDVHHYPLAFNLLPQIDVFEPDGYSHEEWKMIHETKKIFADSSIKVTATCVRVPVVIGHGESVYFTVSDPLASVDEIKQLIDVTKGLVLWDNPKEQLYPQPINVAGRRETFVGRLRCDQENPGAFNMWIVADNLLRGAASNTVEIAECLVRNDLI